MVVDIGVVKNHIKPKADSTLRNMRKDDLIKYIRCLENNYNVAVSFNNQQAKNIELLIPKWIPVSDELPEQYRVVIGWTKFKEMGEVEHDGKGFVWADEEIVPAFVTHWMPLPEPPKGE